MKYDNEVSLFFHLTIVMTDSLAPGLKKREIQLFLLASISHILLAGGDFLLILVNNIVA